MFPQLASRIGAPMGRHRCMIQEELLAEDLRDLSRSWGSVVGFERQRRQFCQEAQ